MKTPLWQAAATFAAFKHRHQLRKDGKTPYFSHPVRVALTIANLFGFDDEAVLAAALMHDLIEDTTTDYDDIKERFGADVAELVACVSKDARMEQDERETAYDKQLAAGPWQARLIKLADVYDNLHDCVDAKSRREHLDKIRRALKLSEKDKQLEKPRRIVQQALRTAERKLRVKA